MPCNIASKCTPCDPVLGNLSSEDEDFFNYIGLVFASQGPPITPNLGWQWTQSGCVAECVSTISQDDADQCAARQQLQCNIDGSLGGNGNPIPTFCNTQQSCVADCPDGLPFTYTVAAGIFCSTSQTMANRIAYNYACSNVKAHRICLSSLTPVTGSVGTAYSGKVTASGGFVSSTSNSWVLISGSLPAGLAFPSIAGTQLAITGTPTQSGVFTFTLQVQAPNGDYMQKQYMITVAAGSLCASPTIKTWTTAAFTGLSFDLGSNANFLNATALDTSTKKTWVIPAGNNSLWFADTYDITSPSPVSPVGAFAVDDGASPQAVQMVYVSGSNKFVILRQHFNGSTYDLWLSFVSGITGSENSHQVGLTTETRNNIFATVDRAGTSSNQVGWLTANSTFHQLYLLNVDAESVITSVTLPGNCTGLCYSCSTDSFFVIHGSDLVEYDRSTLTLKNTYAGSASLCFQMDYIKSTNEIWAWPNSSGGSNPLNVTIIDPTNGTVKTVLTLADKFFGWNSNTLSGYARSYHETLNAFCIPGPDPGFTGNPVYYYIYDVTTRTLKKQIDITSLYTSPGLIDFFCQGFNLANGSIYLSSLHYNTLAGNHGVIEIGTT